MTSFDIKIVKTDTEKNTKEIVTSIMTALYGENDTLPFLNRVLKVFPELTDKIKVGLSYDEIWNTVYESVCSRLEKEDTLIQSKIQHFNRLADEKLVPAIEELMKMFQMSYSEKQYCTCKVGLFNPFPRDVLLKEYCIHYDVSDEIFLRSSIHEINHMILFDKWKKMHGYERKIEPSYPDVLWYLEELAIEPTLNDIRLQAMIPIRHHAYDSFKNIRINGKNLPDHIQAIYDKSEDIEEFLNVSYDFIEKNINNL